MRRMEAVLYEAPADGAPRSPSDGSPDRPGSPEPIFNNLPWPVVVLAGVIVAGYAIQSRFPVQDVANAYAFSPARLAEGDWKRLFTALFLHGGWAHAGMNAAFILAFGVPVGRYFGTRAGGAALFFIFYLICGVFSNLIYAGIYWGHDVALLGASGAASGLMGACARLIAGEGRPGPILSRPVLGMGAAWVIVNLLMGLSGAAVIPGAGDAAIGWEVHLAGFALGVLAFGPLARLARP